MFMTIKNTLILTFIFFSLSFPLIHQASARTPKMIKIQRSIASSRIPSHIKKKALARRALIRRYKRLSAKQKLQLITSMVRTMAALELAHTRRKGLANYHPPHPFWSLFITQAYAVDPIRKDTCFLGGHLVPNRTNNGSCDWDAARRAHLCELGDSSFGVECNRDLFPSSPCVLDFQDAKKKGIRNYSSTQACAYADAHNIKAHIDAGNTNSLTNIGADPNIVSQQLNDDSLWSSPDPNEWVNKRNDILSSQQDQYASLLAEHNEGAIIQEIEKIQGRCDNHVSNNFEKKHCETFKKDLESLRIPTIPPDEAPSPEDDPTTGATSETDSEDENCFDFHKLPGEHFCQVRVAKFDANKGHLVVRLEGTINSNGFAINSPNREAVVYSLDNEKKKYCKDSNFEKKNYVTTPDQQGTSNLSGNSDSSYACYRTENAQFPSTTRFSYGKAEVQIKKKKGYSNMCNITVRNQTINDEYPIFLSKSDNLSNFLPGVRSQCPYVNIDDGASPRVTSDTHMNCLSFFRNQLNARETDRCVDPDVVALRNAANLLKHYNHCNGQNIEVKIGEVGERNRVNHNAYQKLDDWLKNHQSFDNDTRYKIQIKIGRQYRYYPSSNAYENFNSHLEDSPTTWSEYNAKPQFPYGRRDRTISDWLYGDGKSVSNAGENGGLHGVISKLCHPPESSPSASPQTEGERGVR